MLTQSWKGCHSFHSGSQLDLRYALAIESAWAKLIWACKGGMTEKAVKTVAVKSLDMVFMDDSFLFLLGLRAGTVIMIIPAQDERGKVTLFPVRNRVPC